jgi:hypothetical protein
MAKDEENSNELQTLNRAKPSRFRRVSVFCFPLGLVRQPQVPSGRLTDIRQFFNLNPAWKLE